MKNIKKIDFKYGFISLRLVGVTKNNKRKFLLEMKECKVEDIHRVKKAILEIVKS